MYASHDTAIRYARNLDLIIWACLNAFDCSTEKFAQISGRFQPLAHVNDFQAIETGFVLLTSFVELVPTREADVTSEN